MSFRRFVLDAAIKLRLRLTWASAARRIRAQVRDPQAVQNALLCGILAANRDTTFGRQYGFSGLASYAQFRDHVPVCEFEQLRPYIEAQQSTGEHALTAEEPLCYLRTSGSTSKPKDIPLTPSHLHALRKLQRVAVARQLALVPGAFDGSILAITSPAQEGFLSNGKPYGSASGVVAGSTPAILRDKFVVPPSVLAISDSHTKYLLILRLAIARSDVSYLGAANSTTLLTLAKLYREHEEALLRDVRDGGFFLSDQVPPGTLQAIQGQLGPSRKRADELEELRRSVTTRRLRDLWPRLQLVITWTCASAGIAAKALKEELARPTRIVELGYMASEFRGTITLGRRAGSGLPTLDTHFFEFTERDGWNSGRPEYLTLSQLRKGVDYYVIVTTPSGLYRYFINDLVRVTGFLHRTPLLVFVQKGKGVTNITGEKLCESQVISAVSSALEEQALRSPFYILLAEEARFQYRLYVEHESATHFAMEALTGSIESKLSALNIEFQAKRESGRLQPLRGHWLRPGTHEHYKRHSVAKGQREGQFKPPVLALAKQVDFDFDAHRSS